jgi:NADH:ubiquinone oxidoreductase subunit F (NADH-binding)
MTSQLRLIAAGDPLLAPRLLNASAVLPRHGTETLSGLERHDLETHGAEFGVREPLGDRTEQLLADLQEIALTGRGGGHFPVVAKWRSILAAGPGGVVVANAAEGEPGCAKDAVLLQTRPHLVLDGLVTAIEAVGATEGIVWIHDGADATARSLRKALSERSAAGIVDPPIRVFLAPDRYLSGEATSIIRTLEGGPTLPRWVENPARPWSLGHRPVLVQNAETLARVGALALGGVSAYPVTTLLTVINDTYRVVVEAGPETTYGDVVAAAWRSPDGRGPQAVLVGGYGGSWARWDNLRDLPVDNVALRAVGLSTGAGLVGPLPRRACGLEESARLVRYLSGQSARQCGPCVFGLAAVSEIADSLSGGRFTGSERRRLDRFMSEISGRGACRHPDGAIRMLASALDVFGDDVAKHKRGRTCDASLYSVMPLPEEV